MNAPVKKGSGLILPAKYNTAAIISKAIITINMMRISFCAIK